MYLIDQQWQSINRKRAHAYSPQYFIILKDTYSLSSAYIFANTDLLKQVGFVSPYLTLSMAFSTSQNPSLSTYWYCIFKKKTRAEGLNYWLTCMLTHSL